MPDLWVTKEGTASKVTFLLPIPLPFLFSPSEESDFSSLTVWVGKKLEKREFSPIVCQLRSRTGKADASWNSNRPRPQKKMQEAICHRVKRYHPITSRSPKKGEWHTKYIQSGEKRVATNSQLHSQECVNRVKCSWLVSDNWISNKHEREIRINQNVVSPTNCDVTVNRPGCDSVALLESTVDDRAKN